MPLTRRRSAFLDLKYTNNNETAKNRGSFLWFLPLVKRNVALFFLTWPHVRSVKDAGRVDQHILFIGRRLPPQAVPCFPIPPALQTWSRIGTVRRDVHVSACGLPSVLHSQLVHGLVG